MTTSFAGEFVELGSFQQRFLHAVVSSVGLVDQVDQFRIETHFPPKKEEYL